MKKYFPLADSRKKVKVTSPSNESAGDRMQDVLPAATESMSGEIIHLSNREIFERIARLSDQELEERIAILRAACGADVASLLPDKGSNLKIGLFMLQHEKDRRLLAAMLSEKDFKIEDPNMKTAASADILDMTGRATGSEYIQPISHLNTPEGTPEQYTSPNIIRSSRMGKAPMSSGGVARLHGQGLPFSHRRVRSSSQGSGFTMGVRAGLHASYDEDSNICPNSSHFDLHDDDDLVHTDIVEDDSSDDENAFGRDEDSHMKGKGCPHIQIKLRVHGDDLFDPESGKWLVPKLASQLTLAMKAQLKVGGVWPDWTHIPPYAKELMLKEWMARFDFTNEDKINARREFYKHGSNQMRSIMHKARKSALAKCRATSISHCIKTGKPTWLTQKVWRSLITDHWAKDKFILSSSHGKNNRNTLVNGVPSKHTGGSISFVLTGKRMSKEKDREVQFSEVFEKTHNMSPDGASYSGVVDAYKVAMKEKYGPDISTWPFNDNDIYLQTIGRPKKGRYLGLGSSTSLVPLASQIGSSSYHDTFNYDLSSQGGKLQTIQSQVDEMQQNTMNQRTEVATQLKEFEARQEKILDEREDCMKQMIEGEMTEQLDSRDESLVKRLMDVINEAFDKKFGPPKN